MRGEEGEGELRSCLQIIPEALSSPYLQQNGDKMTKMIQTKLSFCISQEPFEQAERLFPCLVSSTLGGPPALPGGLQLQPFPSASLHHLDSSAP